MFSVGRRELGEKELNELVGIVKSFHEWNKKYNKDKKERYISLFHMGDDWNVYTSSNTRGNYFDYVIDDKELEGLEDD